MKKMMILCIIPCIVLVIIFASSMLLPTQLSYPFKVTKGDIKTIENIGYHLQIRTRNFDEISKSATIELKNKNGRITNTKKYHDYRVTSDEMKKVSLDNEVSIYYEEFPVEQSTDSSCKEVRKEVSSLPVRYRIGLKKGEYFYGDIVDKQNNTLILKTGLEYTSDQYQKLYLTRYECDGYSDGSEENGQVVHNREYYYSYYENYAQQDKDNNYYFMPETNESIRGQNKIFKITIASNNVNEYEKRGDVKELVALPENRYYDRMHIIDEKLVVLAHAEDGYYLMQYDLDGTFLQEMKITDDKNKTVVEVYGGGIYAMPSIDNQLYVIDTKTMKIVERSEITEKQRQYTISDMAYQNNTLFILSVNDVWDERGKEDVVNKLKSRNIILQGIKNGEVIFEGKQNLSTQINDNEAPQIAIFTLEFERGDNS